MFRGGFPIKIECYILSFLHDNQAMFIRPILQLTCKTWKDITEYWKKPNYKEHGYFVHEIIKQIEEEDSLAMWTFDNLIDVYYLEYIGYYRRHMPWHYHNLKYYLKYCNILFAHNLRYVTCCRLEDFEDYASHFKNELFGTRESIRKTIKRIAMDKNQDGGTKLHICLKNEYITKDYILAPDNIRLLRFTGSKEIKNHFKIYRKALDKDTRKKFVEGFFNETNQCYRNILDWETMLED